MRKFRIIWLLVLIGALLYLVVDPNPITKSDLELVGIKLKNKPFHDEGVGDVAFDEYHLYGNHTEKRHVIESSLFYYTNAEKILSLNSGDSIFVYVKLERSINEKLNKIIRVYGMYSKKMG
jgi:hypothetical protein